MKKALFQSIFFGVLIFKLHLFTTFIPAGQLVDERTKLEVVGKTLDLKEEAFSVLKLKCNVCHRKQNPFRVFSLKNMERNAARIYKQVFILKRMPKGDKFILTEQEYQRLKQWLETLNTY